MKEKDTGMNDCADEAPRIRESKHAHGRYKLLVRKKNKLWWFEQEIPPHTHTQVKSEAFEFLIDGQLVVV